MDKPEETQNNGLIEVLEQYATRKRRELAAALEADCVGEPITGSVLLAAGFAALGAGAAGPLTRGLKRRDSSCR